MITLAAVDPGVKTGYAVCRFSEISSQVLIHTKVSFTINEEKDTDTVLKETQPTAIVFEKLPRIPSSVGQHTWYKVYEQFTRRGFYPSPKNTNTIEQGHIYLIMAGLWKPVMKTVDIPYIQWLCTNQHERDATAMLLFWIRTLTEGKEVQYVSE